jgi:enoyl-CoA hydratase
MADDEYQFLLYEPLDDGRIVRILLNRPEARNAQNRGLLVELDDAFRRAEADDEVRVVILGGTGPMFSSGHDLGSKVSMEEAMSGTTSSRTPGAGGTCARSRSARPTATSSPRG